MVIVLFILLLVVVVLSRNCREGFISRFNDKRSGRSHSRNIKCIVGNFYVPTGIKKNTKEPIIYYGINSKQNIASDLAIGKFFNCTVNLIGTDDNEGTHVDLVKKILGKQRIKHNNPDLRKVAQITFDPQRIHWEKVETGLTDSSDLKKNSPHIVKIDGYNLAKMFQNNIYPEILFICGNIPPMMDLSDIYTTIKKTNDSISLLKKDAKSFVI